MSEKDKKSTLSNLEKLKEIFPDLNVLKLEEESKETDNLLYKVESTINLHEKTSNYKLLRTPKDVIIVDVANLFNLEMKGGEEDFNIRIGVELILSNLLKNDPKNRKPIISTTENGVHYWFQKPDDKWMSVLEKTIKNKNDKFSWNSFTLPVSYHWYDIDAGHVNNEDLEQYFLGNTIDRESYYSEYPKKIKSVDTKSLMKSNAYIFYNKNNFKQEYTFNDVKSISDLPKLPLLFLPLQGAQRIRKDKLIGYKYYTNTMRSFLTLISKYHKNEKNGKKPTKNGQEILKQHIFKVFNIFLNLKFKDDYEVNYAYIWNFFCESIFPIFNKNTNLKDYIEVNFPKPNYLNEKDQQVIPFNVFLEKKLYLEKNGNLESAYYAFKKFDLSANKLYHRSNILNFYSCDDFINYLTIREMKEEYTIYKKTFEKNKKKTKKKPIDDVVVDDGEEVFKAKHNTMRDKIFVDFAKQIKLKFNFDNLIKPKDLKPDTFNENPDLADVFISVFNKGSYLATIDAKQKKFEISASDLAKYLVNVHLFMYNTEKKKIYRWEKSHYRTDEKDNEGIFSTAIKDALTKSILTIWPDYELNEKKLKDLYLKINAIADLRVLAKKFLVVKNGIINLDNNVLLPVEETINYKVFDTMQANYIPNFENLKKSEQYQRHYNDYTEFMNNVLTEQDPVEDEKLKNLYYSMAASLLVRGEQLKKIFIFIGRSDSGKSTLLKWINYTYPVSKISSFTLGQMDNHKNATGYMLGKWGNIQNDVPPESIIDGSVLKPITGGDSITAEVKYADVDTNVFLSTKIIVGCNEFPRFKNDDAIFNRLVVISIDNVINFKDPKIISINKKIFDKRTKKPHQIFIDIWFHEMLKRYQELKKKGVWFWFSDENNYPKSTFSEKKKQLVKMDQVSSWMNEFQITWKDLIGRTSSEIYGKLDLETRAYPWSLSFCKYCDDVGVDIKHRVSGRKILDRINKVLQQQAKEIYKWKTQGVQKIGIKDLRQKMIIKNEKEIAIYEEREELVEKAKENNVEISDKMSNDDILEALNITRKSLKKGVDNHKLKPKEPESNLKDVLKGRIKNK